MTKFKCSSCGFEKDVSDQYAGKKVLCPKCKAPNVVLNQQSAQPPQNPTNLIKFNCPLCHKKMAVSAEFTGKRVKCTGCSHIFAVPATEQPQSETENNPPQDNLFASAQDLLNMEMKAKAVAMPELSRTPAAPEQSENKSDYTRQEVKSPIKENSSLKNTLITAVIVISVLAVILFGLAGKPENPIKELSADQSQIDDFNDFALNCITKIMNGEVNDVVSSFSPELRTDTSLNTLKRISSPSNKKSKDDYAMISHQAMQEPSGTLYWLDYTSRDDKQKIMIVISGKSESKALEGITVFSSDDFRNSVSVRSSLCENAAKNFVKTKATPFVKFVFKFLLVWLLLTLFIIVSLAIVFHKADEPAWAAIIPVYNCWVLAKVGDRPGFLGLAAILTTIIPYYIGLIISLILFFYISIGVAKTFNRGILFAIGLCLLPFIFYPILAFTQN